MPTFQDFEELDIRVGTIRKAVEHPTARKPSYQMWIDFGELGTRTSSAQLTERYALETLVNRQVVAVTNFPPRRVADFTSEVLVLGVMVSDQDVVLLGPDAPVPNGARIG